MAELHTGSSDVSQQLVTGLAEDAICSVCHEEYNDARFLPCHHYFCRDCIDRCLMAAHCANVMICPECREEMPRPLAADKLKPAFPANRLKNRLQQARTALQLDEASRNRAPKTCEFMCSHHSTTEVKFFCFECNQLVCETCRHTQHVDHKVDRVTEAADYLRKVFLNYCEALRATKEEIEGSGFRQNFVIRKKDILNQADTVSAEVVRSFDDMISSLISRKEELLKLVLDTKEHKLASLDEQESSIVNLIASASDLIAKADKLQSLSELEFLNTALQLIDMAFSCRGVLSAKCLIPTEVTGIAARITCIEDIKELCKTKATVFTSQVETYGLCVAELGEPHSFHVCPAAPVSSAEAISATLTPLHGTTTVPVTVSKLAGSAQYKATYTPKERGRHRLVVAIGGQSITGGLIDVCVYPKLTGGDRMPEFSVHTSSPTCVAVNSQGQLIISSSIKNHVFVCTRKGKKLFELKGHKLCSPYGVAVDKEDSIFVTEEAAHLVSKFSGDGKFIKSFGRQGEGDGELDSPKAVKVIQNQVYVCDQKNRRIQVLSVDLEHVTTISLDLQATDVALDAQSNLYVVVQGGLPMIHQYDSKGLVYQGMIKHKDFCSLSGICFDAVQNFIYAVDITSCCVMQMTPDPAGECVATFCRKGTGDGELLSPCGIAVDPDGYLYVCDTGNNRVLVF